MNAHDAIYVSNDDDDDDAGSNSSAAADALLRENEAVDTVESTDSRSSLMLANTIDVDAEVEEKLTPLALTSDAYDEVVAQLRAMFPQMDVDTVESVVQLNNCDAEASTRTLLQLGDPTDMRHTDALVRLAVWRALCCVPRVRLMTYITPEFLREAVSLVGLQLQVREEQLAERARAAARVLLLRFYGVRQEHIDLMDMEGTCGKVPVQLRAMFRQRLAEEAMQHERIRLSAEELETLFIACEDAPDSIGSEIGKIRQSRSDVRLFLVVHACFSTVRRCLSLTTLFTLVSW